MSKQNLPHIIVSYTNLIVRIHRVYHNKSKPMFIMPQEFQCELGVKKYQFGNPSYIAQESAFLLHWHAFINSRV